MSTKTLEVLDKSACAKMNDACLEVLAKTGLRMDDPQVRAILKKNGCEVDERTRIVRFPASLVNDCVKKCPDHFEISGREKKNRYTVSCNGPLHYSNFGTAVKWGTFDSNGHYVTRPTALKDVGTALGMIDALPNFSMGVTACSALDLMGTAVQKDVHEQLEVMKHCTKHTMADWTSGHLHYAFEMEKACYGGDEEEALAHPLYTIGAPTVSPLTNDSSFGTCVREATKYHMSVMAMGMVLSGASSPVFTAGNLVVAIAESLGTITLAQCLNPGNPLWFGSSGTILDLKAGTPSCGCPERALISAAYANMGAFYKIPTFIAGSEADAKVIDYQNAHEKTLTGLLPLLAGASMCFGPGMLEAGLTFSPDQLLLDNDMISMTKKAFEGIRMDAEALSVADIERIGPGGNFLAEPETLNNINLLSSPEIFDRTGWNEWLAAGGKDSAQVAHAKAEQMISELHPTPLDKDVQKDVEALVARIDKECRAKEA